MRWNGIMELLMYEVMRLMEELRTFLKFYQFHRLIIFLLLFFGDGLGKSMNAGRNFRRHQGLKLEVDICLLTSLTGGIYFVLFVWRVLNSEGISFEE